MRCCTYALAALALLLVGCSDDEPVEMTVPTTAAPLLITGNVIQLTVLGPFEGAQICDLGGTQCATSDSEGDFVLELVPEGDSALRITADGVETTIVALSSAERDAYVEIEVVPEGLLAQATGLSMDPSLGSFFLLRAPTEVTAALEGAGDGPYYFPQPGPPDPNATATVGAGGVLFLDVEPGTRPITFTHASLNCIVPSWPSGFPFEAGAITMVSRLTCN